MKQFAKIFETETGQVLVELLMSYENEEGEDVPALRVTTYTKNSSRVEAAYQFSSDDEGIDGAIDAFEGFTQVEADGFLKSLGGARL